MKEKKNIKYILMYAHIINKIIKDNSLYNKEEIIKLSSKVILNQFKYDLATRSIISCPCCNSFK